MTRRSPTIPSSADLAAFFKKYSPRTRSVDASSAHLKKYGVTRSEALKLERALVVLADFEGALKQALSEIGDGASDHDHAHVCAAIRQIVDGE